LEEPKSAATCSDRTESCGENTVGNKCHKKGCRTDGKLIPIGEI